MKYFYLLQSGKTGADTYDSLVVCAYSEDEARSISPCTDPVTGEFMQVSALTFQEWVARPSEVTVKYLGIADESIQVGSVICASFNAS